jgi:K(+)-stimulated pyrophosphate-energized sodium pump
MQQLTPFEMNAIWTILALALLSIGYAFFLRSRMLAKEKGVDDALAIWQAAREEGNAAIHRLFRNFLIGSILLSLLFAASVQVVPLASDALSQQAMLWGAVWRAVGFLAGALLAAFAAPAVIRSAVQSHTRVMVAAQKGYPQAVAVAYRAAIIPIPAAIGMLLIVGVAFFLLLGANANDPVTIFAFGTGGLFAMLMMRFGGQRRPASSANEAGEGDEAAAASLLHSSVYESASTATTLTGITTLLLSLSFLAGLLMTDAVQVVLFPFMVVGIGLLASLVGNASVKTNEQRRNARAATSKGFYFTVLLSVIGMAALTPFLLADPQSGAIAWRPLAAVFVGIVLAVGVERLNFAFAPVFFNPYKKVNRSSMFAAMVMGRVPNLWALLAFAVALLATFVLYGSEPLDIRLPSLIYGIALVGFGVLTVAGYIIAVDTFGAITRQSHITGQAVELGKNPRNNLEDLAETGAMLKGTTRGITLCLVIIALLVLAGSIYTTLFSLPA